jgi:hypothetical protein
MLQHIEERANLSVARGCGFAAIAVVMFMVSLSSQVALSFQAGGFLSLLICMVLLLKSYGASRRPYKRTELWVMLAPDERPDAAIAQGIISKVLREVYLRFALCAAWLSAGMLALALIAFLVGKI